MLVSDVAPRLRTPPPPQPARPRPTVLLFWIVLVAWRLALPRRSCACAWPCAAGKGEGCLLPSLCRWTVGLARGGTPVVLDRCKTIQMQHPLHQHRHHHRHAAHGHSACTPRVDADFGALGARFASNLSASGIGSRCRPPATSETGAQERTHSTREAGKARAMS